MRLRLFGIFLLAFLAVYGSADLITSLHGWRWPMAPTRWPFWPEWAAVYLSLDLLIPLAFWRSARPAHLTMSLLVCTLLAWPLFLLFPLPAIAPPPSATLPATFHLADRLNLSGNFFPSLHVAYALLCGAFLARPWSWGWGLAIAFSTLVTHQHYTVDLLAGAALAWWGYRWASGPGQVETACLGELARCASRHRRYALIAAGLYAASLASPRRRRLARVGFCYLQHLDDLLDGHLSAPDGEEPEELASQHQQALRGRRPFPQDVAGRLGQTLAGELQARGEGLSWTVELVEEMKLDRRRVAQAMLLEEDELDRHLRRTFELSLDLMLLAADSPLRAADVPHLVDSLAWCSVVRDLQEDQALGLVNLPAQVWREESAPAWFARRHAAVIEHLRLADLELQALQGQPGHGLLRIFHRSVAGYARREGAQKP